MRRGLGRDVRHRYLPAFFTGPARRRYFPPSARRLPGLPQTAEQVEARLTLRGLVLIELGFELSRYIGSGCEHGHTKSICHSLTLTSCCLRTEQSGFGQPPAGACLTDTLSPHVAHAGADIDAQPALAGLLRPFQA